MDKERVDKGKVNSGMMERKRVDKVRVGKGTIDSFIVKIEIV